MKKKFELILLFTIVAGMSACSSSDETENSVVNKVTAWGEAKMDLSGSTRSYWNDDTSTGPFASSAFTWNSTNIPNVFMIGSDGNFAVDATNSTKAYWPTVLDQTGTSTVLKWEANTSSLWNDGDYCMYLSHPLPVYSGTNKTRLSAVVSIPSTLTGAKANNLSYLENYSYLYSIGHKVVPTTSNPKNVENKPFRMLPAIIRFAITNKNVSDIIVKSVTMESSVATFYSQGTVTFAAIASNSSFDNALFSNVTFAGDEASKTASVKVETETTSEPVVSKDGSVNLYAMVLPTATFTSGSYFNFKITICNGDGTNERTYLSSKINVSTLAGLTSPVTSFAMGSHMYTFKLYVDDELNVVYTPVVFPTWGETEL